MEPPQGEDMMPPPANTENDLRQIENVKMDHPEDTVTENENTLTNNNTNEEPQVTSNTYKSVVVNKPKIELPSQHINT